MEFRYSSFYFVGKCPVQIQVPLSLFIHSWVRILPHLLDAISCSIRTEDLPTVDTELIMFKVYILSVLLDDQAGGSQWTKVQQLIFNLVWSERHPDYVLCSMMKTS